MQLRYNYRLDPRPGHRAALGKAFGCARVVFNDALDAREAAHRAGKRSVTDSELSARRELRPSGRSGCQAPPTTPVPTRAVIPSHQWGPGLAVSIHQVAPASW
jgi:Helix-turn-helix domain